MEVVEPSRTNQVEAARYHLIHRFIRPWNIPLVREISVIVDDIVMGASTTKLLQDQELSFHEIHLFGSSMVALSEFAAVLVLVVVVVVVSNSIARSTVLAVNLNIDAGSTSGIGGYQMPMTGVLL